MLNHWYKQEDLAYCLSQGILTLRTPGELNEANQIPKKSTAFLTLQNKHCRAVRQNLMAYYSYFGTHQLFDFGNLIKHDFNYNIQFFLELISGNINITLMDRSYQWYAGMVGSIQKTHHKTKNLCISNTILFSEYGIRSDFLGFQRHVCNPDHLDTIMDYSIDSMSLGKIRAESELLEPVLRDVECAYFDLASIRKSDAPGSYNSLPSGFTCEEACQIMKYLGQNQHLKMVILGGDFTIDDTTISCISEMLWYYFEGRAQQATDHPEESKDFKEYVVEFESIDDKCSFWRSEETGRWWFKTGDGKPFISCSENEYSKAAKDELPDRLLRHLIAY